MNYGLFLGIIIFSFIICLIIVYFLIWAIFIRKTNSEEGEFCNNDLDCNNGLFCVGGNQCSTNFNLSDIDCPCITNSSCQLGYLCINGKCNIQENIAFSSFISNNSTSNNSTSNNSISNNSISNNSISNNSTSNNSISNNSTSNNSISNNSTSNNSTSNNSTSNNSTSNNSISKLLSLLPKSKYKEQYIKNREKYKKQEIKNRKLEKDKFKYLKVIDNEIIYYLYIRNNTDGEWLTIDDLHERKMQKFYFNNNTLLMYDPITKKQYNCIITENNTIRKTTDNITSNFYIDNQDGGYYIYNNRHKILNNYNGYGSFNFGTPVLFN